MAPAEELPVGFGADGTLATLPLATLHRHLIVTGTTGYGKSGLLLSLVLGLLRRRTGTRVIFVDIKGEAASELRDHFLPTLPGLGIDSATVVSIAPFSSWTVPLNPLAPIPGLPVESQAQLVCELIGGLVDGIGVRMATILQWTVRAAMEVRGSLLTVRRLLVDEPARAGVAARVRDGAVRHYLTELLPREPATSIESVRARIEAITLLPAMRAMLCAEGSLSGSELIEAPVTVVDLSGAPMGSERTAQFVGSWIFTLLAAAAMSRRVTSATPPVALVVDEWHRLAGAFGSGEEFERLLSQVRFKRVGLWLANQSLGQVSSVSPALRDCLATNIALSFHFRPTRDDLRELEGLLPITGRQVDPSQPDRLLSRDEERRRYLAELAALPPRACLVADRIAGRAEVLRTLSLPYEEAHRRSALLSERERDAWVRGRFGVPVEHAVPAVTTPEPPREEAEESPAARPAPSRKRAERLRLVVP